MEITKEDFERAISLAYQRGRVTPIRYIEQNEIDTCISDIYELLNLAQQKDYRRCQECGGIIGSYSATCNSGQHTRTA